MEERGSARSGMLFGGVLVVAGTVLLLERLDVLHTDLLRHFWPLVLLLAAIALFTGRGEHGKPIAVALVIIDIGLELQKLGVLRINLWDLWPVGIMALGAFLLWRALRPPQPDADNSLILESQISEYAIFGGGDIRVVSDNFTGGSITAVFGGYEIDFTTSTIANSPAVLYADAIFGGVSMRVPPTWNVITQGPAIFGGIDSKALPPADTAAPGQCLVVKGLAIFGGIEIKTRK